MLDEGRLTDNKGVVVDFRNTIIILTSNIASDKIVEIEDTNKKKSAVLNELKKFFKPEFINRLDDIVIFNSLMLSEIIKVVDIMFGEIKNKLKDKSINIELTQEAKEEIGRIGYDPTFGARPLKRALYEIIEDKIADMILEDKLKEGSTITFDFIDNEIAYKIK